MRLEKKRMSKETCKRIRELRKTRERLTDRYWKGDDEYGAVFFVREGINKDLSTLVPDRETRDIVIYS